MIKSIFGGLWVKKGWNTANGKLSARSEIAGSWGMSVQLYQIVFWSGCTTLYSGQQFWRFIYLGEQYVRVTVDLYPL